MRSRLSKGMDIQGERGTIMIMTDNKIAEFWSEDDFSVEIIPLPDGGADIKYHMSDRARAYFECEAKNAGMTVVELIESRLKAE